MKKIKEFGEYVETLNELDNNDKSIQNRKFIHFTRYVRGSLIRHFKRWTGDVLFVCLFSNQPIASILAKPLKGEDINRLAGELFDEYYNRFINNK